jgi:transcriptional regulator with XRE-family HTH domain
MTNCVNGDALRQIRKSRNLTLQKAQALCGVHYVNIHEIESGKKQPKISTLIKLLKGYDMKLALMAYNNHSTWDLRNLLDNKE